MSDQYWNKIKKDAFDEMEKVHQPHVGKTIGQAVDDLLMSAEWVNATDKAALVLLFIKTHLSDSKKS